MVIGLLILGVLILILFVLASSAKLSPATSFLFLSLAIFIIVAVNMQEEDATPVATNTQDYKASLSKMDEFEITQELLNKAGFNYLNSMGNTLRGNLSHDQVMKLDLSRFPEHQRSTLFNNLISSGTLR